MTEKKNTFFNFTSTLGRIILLGLVILFLINIARSIYKNHDVKKQIANLESEINALENQKLNLENRILYYETPTYKELEARQHLNYKKKGEKVITLLVKNDPETNQNTVEHNEPQKEIKSTDNTPNWQKWMKYLFG